MGRSADGFQLRVKNSVSCLVLLLCWLVMGLTAMSGLLAVGVSALTVGSAVLGVGLIVLSVRFGRAGLWLESDGKVVVRGPFRTRVVPVDTPLSARVVDDFSWWREWLEVSGDGWVTKVEAPRFLGRFGPDLDAAAVVLSADDRRSPEYEHPQATCEGP